ncbi:unnamed protein product, partial [Porites evermanni]
ENAESSISDLQDFKRRIPPEPPTSDSSAMEALASVLKFNFEGLSITITFECVLLLMVDVNQQGYNKVEKRVVIATTANEDLLEPTTEFHASCEAIMRQLAKGKAGFH